MFEEIPEVKTSIDEQRKQLTEKLKAYMAEPLDGFKVGDSVRWKEGLKNCKLPAVGALGIVAEVFPEPVKDPNAEAGTDAFMYKYDIRISCIDPRSGSFKTFAFDSHYFELVD